MLGGRYRGSFRPLNDAIIDGRIQGAVAIVGCNNPRVMHDEAHFNLVKEFIANDYLVVQTGCGAIASAKYGLLLGEAMEMAGPGLESICEATGMPPVLHLGSCVDNSRILTVLTAVVEEGGLGDDISDLPAVGIAPEWMSEKALAIATYCAASGAYVLMGVTISGQGEPGGRRPALHRLGGEVRRQGGVRAGSEEDLREDRGAYPEEAEGAGHRHQEGARALRHGRKEGAACLR